MNNRVQSGEIRFEWHEAVVRECQLFAWRARVMCNPDELMSLAHELVQALRDPSNAVEERLLRALLADVAAKWGTIIHNRAHRRATDPCQFDHLAFTQGLWEQSSRPAKRVLTDWANSL